MWEYTDLKKIKNKKNLKKGNKYFWKWLWLQVFSQENKANQEIFRAHDQNIS